MPPADRFPVGEAAAALLLGAGLTPCDAPRGVAEAYSQSPGNGHVLDVPWVQVDDAAAVVCCGVGVAMGHRMFTRRRGHLVVAHEAYWIGACPVCRTVFWRRIR